jgi:hypothetical protein
MENQQAAVMSTKDWIITILISAIPLVGFVMLFIWAFGSGENPNKANWAKATLIWFLIGCVLFMILWFTIIASVIAAGGMMNA